MELLCFNIFGRDPMLFKCTKHLPGVGMRNVKTALAATLCAWYIYFLDRSSGFCCIGAIFGMGSDYGTSKLHGATGFSARWWAASSAWAVCHLRRHLPGRQQPLVPDPPDLCGRGGADPGLPADLGRRRPAGGVVLCIILFNTPIDSYVSYALNRILDTGIGVLVALFVNGMLPGGFTFGFMHRFYLRVGIPDDV